VAGESAQRPEPPGGPPTTLVLVRHGVTAHTTERRFSGGLGSANPGLSGEGREQVRATGEWLSPVSDRVDALLSSPVRRTRESADILAPILGHAVEEEEAFAEMEFGAWDGLTFGEVEENHPADLRAWLGTLDVVPGGTGESFQAVEARVLAGLRSVLETHAGRIVVLVSHVTPIKTLVAHALGAPLEALFHMELAPASVTVLGYYPQPDRDPHPSMRMFNAVPPGRPLLVEPRAW
jgi:ribonuclease H / adenosylcobalamin/alpha-ribazole phosphatase